MQLWYLSDHFSIEAVLGIAQGRHDAGWEVGKGRNMQYGPLQTCFNHFQKVCIACKYNKHCLPPPRININLLRHTTTPDLIPTRMQEFQRSTWAYQQQTTLYTSECLWQSPDQIWERGFTWICVLIKALPIKEARKNFQNGTRNCPHMMPARSNSGFGTCTHHHLLDKDHWMKKNLLLQWKENSTHNDKPYPSNSAFKSYNALIHTSCNKATQLLSGRGRIPKQKGGS